MPRHLPFVDWLKTAGLALIVYGHVAMATSPRATPPVYQKQLGVAFFVFATGYLLAPERRTGWRVLYNRLFQLWAIGLGFAAVMSLVGVAGWGDLNESNYLPFAFGANTLIDAFPANPTTWYLGTYLHILLIWAVVFRGRRIGLPGIALTAAVEIASRALLVESAGRFVAYTFVGNWMTVFALGLWFGRGAAAAEPGGAPWRPAAILAALAIGWPLAARALPWQLTFPFMSLPDAAWPGLIGLSLAASFVYVSYTLSAYALARTLPAVRWVALVARNTPFVVIVHMPVYALLDWALRPVLPYAWLASIEFVVCFAGLTLVSEALQPWLALNRRRDELAAAIEKLFGTSTPAPVRTTN